MSKTISGSAAFFRVPADALGVVLLFRKRKSRVTMGRIWLALIVTLYWAMSVPATSGWLLQALGGDFAPLVEAADANGANAIVVLGGGSASLRAGEHVVDLLSTQTAFSVLEAARVSRMLGTPLIIASGGRPAPEQQLHSEAEVMRGALVRSGFQPNASCSNRTSVNTHDQALAVPASCASTVDRWILVTARATCHARSACFGRRASTWCRRLRPPIGRRREGWWPSMDALQTAAGRFTNILALAFSWVRGWF